MARPYGNDIGKQLAMGLLPLALSLLVQACGGSRPACHPSSHPCEGANICLAQRCEPKSVPLAKTERASLPPLRSAQLLPNPDPSPASLQTGGPKGRSRFLLSFRLPEGRLSIMRALLRLPFATGNLPTSEPLKLSAFRLDASGVRWSAPSAGASFGPPLGSVEAEQTSGGQLVIDLGDGLKSATGGDEVLLVIESPQRSEPAVHLSGLQSGPGPRLDLYLKRAENE